MLEAIHSRGATEWTNTSHDKRAAHLNYLLEGLEHKDVEIRYYSCKRILYLVQGMSGSLSYRSSIILILYRDLWRNSIYRRANTLDDRELQDAMGHQRHWDYYDCYKAFKFKA